MRNTLERRLKLLNMEGMGFSKIDIVNNLTTQYGCTKQCVYQDFKKRGAWQPLIEQYDPETTMLKITNRYNTIYRKAAFIFLQNKNPLVQISALRTMLESSKALCEVVIPKEQQPTEPTPETEQKWYDHDSLSAEEKETMREASRLLRRIEKKGARPHVKIH